MGIRRRSLIGGALLGLGEGLTGLSAESVKRRQLDDQRAFELQKLQFGELKDLQNNLASHPDLVPFYLQTADANPLLRGVDLSAYKSGAQTMGLQGLLNQLNTASSPEAIPADLQTALETRTGTPQPPMASVGPTLSPEMQRLTDTANARRQQLQLAEDDKTALIGKRKRVENFGGTMGTGEATHALAPTSLADSLEKIVAEGPPLATVAGLRKGAEIDAEQDPGRARRQGEIIGMHELSRQRSLNAAKNEQAPTDLQQELEKIKQTGAPLATAAGLREAAMKRASLAPDIVTGEAGAAGKKAGAVKDAELKVEFTPENITGAANKAAAIEAGKPASDAERQSASFYVRSVRGHNAALALEAKGVSYSGANNLPQVVQSALMKEYNQAKQEFILAALRKETGAAISNQELAAFDKTYFGQPNDPPAVLKQKQEARAAMIRGLKPQGGRAWNEYGKQGISTPEMVQPGDTLNTLMGGPN